MQVYDVSSYMDDHPGGDDVMLDVTGKLYIISLLLSIFFFKASFYLTIHICPIFPLTLKVTYLGPLSINFVPNFVIC